RQQLAALSVPKCENAFGFHRLIPRQFDNVVLCATSTLTLPSSVNATTACSGCRARCSYEFILSFSADKGGRCSPRHRERNCLASAFACSSFGLVSGALALKSPPVVSKTGHERKRIKNRNLQAVRRVLRGDEEDSVSAVRFEEMARNRFRGLACKPWRQWWRR